MDDGEKPTGEEQHIFLVLGVLAFVVAVVLIILVISAFHASSVSVPSKDKPVIHEMFRASTL